MTRFGIWFAWLNGNGCIAYMFIMARYHWITRRIVPRRDAPTHGEWVRPRSHY